MSPDLVRTARRLARRRIRAQVLLRQPAPAAARRAEPTVKDTARR